jgi:hypothetical protein
MIRLSEQMAGEKSGLEVVFRRFCPMPAQPELFIPHQAKAVIMLLCRALPNTAEAPRSNQKTTKNLENNSELQNIFLETRLQSRMIRKPEINSPNPTDANQSPTKAYY